MARIWGVFHIVFILGLLLKSSQASKIIDQSGNYPSCKYATYKVLSPWEIHDLVVFSLQTKRLPSKMLHSSI